MKRIDNLYSQVYDFAALYDAFINAAKGKRFRDEVMIFAENLEENLIQIQNELIHKTYAVGRYREFYVHEPKRRLIMALPFKDRVVQWSIYNVLYPIFAKGFIYDNCACVRGRGAHAAVDRTQYWMRLLEKQHDRVYYLKLDISKFFYRIDHAVLMDIIRAKIKDADLLWLLDTVINSEDVAFGLPLGVNPGPTDRLFECGMPIGNLTSQLFANVYMNEVDQYVKRKLKVRHYVRYMDDMVLFSDSKLLLHEYKKIIELFLNEQLKLHLNNKTAIRPITLGLDFCGYRIWPTHRRLRKGTALAMKRNLKAKQRQYERGEISLEQVLSTVNSYRGLLSHCNSYNLREAIFGGHYADDPGWFFLKRISADEEPAAE